MAKEKKEETEETTIVETVQEEKKADYVFISEFKTTKESFIAGDDCFFENKDVIEYLLKIKKIKSNGNN